MCSYISFFVSACFAFCNFGHHAEPEQDDDYPVNQTETKLKPLGPLNS